MAAFGCSGGYLAHRSRLAAGLVLLLGFGFLGWLVWFAGTTISAQFEALRQVVTAQFERLVAFAATLGLVPEGAISRSSAASC